MKPQYQITKRTVLVVDDHPEQLGALFTALQNENYSLLIAKNGSDTFRLLERTQPDVILLDVKLPDMDGFEICRKLKQKDALRKIPVLFTTAITELTDKLEGFRAGGADYITKPFQIEEVLARVKTQLTLGKLQQEVLAEKERFKGLSNATFEGILLHDQEQIIEVNQTLEKLLGYSRKELLEHKLQDLLTPEFCRFLYDLIPSETLRPYEFQACRKDGNMIPLEVQSRTIRYKESQVYVLALRDISWRKTLEAQTRQLESENIILKASLSERDHLGELIGRSPVMQKVYERILKAAVSDAPVIIYGETGTGKELAARTISQLSEKVSGNFNPVNCAAIPETLFESQFFGHRQGAFTGATQNKPGYFENAQNGVLFLDEISELTPAIQAKLLRVLDTGEYTPVGATKTRIADVRIIAATNQPLRSLVEAGKFREDLFHRLHVITLDMPPLRQHKEDLPLLVSHFFRQLHPETGTRPRLPDDILVRFKDYDWPGNVRELVNAVRRYMAMDEVELHSCTSRAGAESAAESESGRSASGQTFHEQIEIFERRVIKDALDSVNGNRTKVAEILKIPPATLYRKIQKYNL